MNWNYVVKKTAGWSLVIFPFAILIYVMPPVGYILRGVVVFAGVLLAGMYLLGIFDV